MQQQILQLLSTQAELHSKELLEKLGSTYEAMDAALKSLVVAEYVILENVKFNKWFLTKEGEEYAHKGTPEFQLYRLSTKEGTPAPEVEKALGGAYKIALGNAIKKGLVKVKDGKVFQVAEGATDVDRAKLSSIAEGKDNLTDDDKKFLKSRKLAEEKSVIHYIIRKGPHYKETKVTLEPELTSEMLASDAWKERHFKKFNLQALGAQVQNGNLHPLMKTRSQFRDILLELGFEEMRTDRYVESSFWNFDALFQPQFHPARDAHDTFFVSDPENCKKDDDAYWKEVKQIHEKGGYGSSGYDCEWSEKEAKKNILRTHTTAISSRVLYEISKKKDFRPRKFFSIDRVFRNETLDMTHLAEFYQIEGFVIDRNLGLPHLIGIITEFYKKIGIEKIWLKPTYNPYTQPSMEIYGYHPILKRKVEIGNSGIFRPEMLRPMGFPEDMNVIAWGLGLERPTMIQYNIGSIKELFGPGVSIEKLKENGICCLTK